MGHGLSFLDNYSAGVVGYFHPVYQFLHDGYLGYHKIVRWILQIDGLVQERHNSSALAMELRLSCTNPLK